MTTYQPVQPFQARDCQKALEKMPVDEAYRIHRMSVLLSLNVPDLSKANALTVLAAVGRVLK